MVVTEQYPPARRFDENKKTKSLQDIENELTAQCKSNDPKSVVPKYILGIFGKESIDIRNSPVYWTHMIKCFSNFGRNGLVNRKDVGHPENFKNIQQSSSQCITHLQEEISEFGNLEFIIPFGQNAMKCVYEAITSNDFNPSFQPIELKKPFYQVVAGAPPEGYSFSIGKNKRKTIRIFPFYHPSRRNIFESQHHEILKFTSIEKNSGEKNPYDEPGSFVKFLREKYCD